MLSAMFFSYSNLNRKKERERAKMSGLHENSSAKHCTGSDKC